MRGGRVGGRRGVTLIETLIAMGLLATLAVGLYACGLTVKKMRLYNAISAESRALAMQKLEEVAAGGFANIVALAPFAPQTNNLADRYQIIREVEITGHTTNRTVTTNLANSAYLEVQVRVAYYSPLSGRAITDSYATIVR